MVAGIGDVTQPDALPHVVDRAPADHRDGESRPAVEIAKKLAALLRQYGILGPRHDVRQRSIKVECHKYLSLGRNALVHEVHVVAQVGQSGLQWGPQTPPRTISRRKRPAQA